MLKWFNPAIAMLAISGCGADEPPFTFRTIDVTTTLLSAKKVGLVSDCNTKAGSGTCSLIGEPISGAATAEQTLDFTDGRFSRLAIQFPIENAGAVRDNLVAAYGEPCGREIGDVESTAGPIADNKREFWCFKEGRLVFERYPYGISVGKSLIEFPYQGRNVATAQGPGDL
ncbi:MAG: hypothetical protein PGN16_03910 [Sphingomonas phyllosphaerae]